MSLRALNFKINRSTQSTDPEAHGGKNTINIQLLQSSENIPLQIICTKSKGITFKCRSGITRFPLHRLIFPRESSSIRAMMIARVKQKQYRCLDNAMV
jgi:hypothetical protein